MKLYVIEWHYSDYDGGTGGVSSIWSNMPLALNELNRLRSDKNLVDEYEIVSVTLDTSVEY